MTDYHPKPSNAAKQSVADTFNAVGATIVSTQWYGWGPNESKCKDNGDNPRSSFSISNLKVSGTVLMGPTPSKCSGSPTPPPPSPQPTPPTPPSPTPCTAADTDPWGTGSEVPCCDGLQKVLKKWDGDGNNYYKCVATPSPTPEPTPSPTPSAPPTPPSPTPCTAANRNPFGTGSEVPCCNSLQKVLKNWDGDGNYYYKCLATPSPTPEPTPSPRPSPSPPTPKPSPAGGKCCWGGCSGDCHSDTYCDASENQCSDNCSGKWCAASFEVVV